MTPRSLVSALLAVVLLVGVVACDWPYERIITLNDDTDVIVEYHEEGGASIPYEGTPTLDDDAVFETSRRLLVPPEPEPDPNCVEVPNGDPLVTTYDCHGWSDG